MVRAVEPDFADAVAAGLLRRYGSLSALLAEPVDALAAATGNPALAKMLGSARSVVIESLLGEIPDQAFSASNQSVLRYISATMAGLTHEEAHVFFLDARLRLLRHELFAHGTTGAVEFPVQPILRRALQIGAGQLVLVHNHPSGSPEPSDIDKDVTRRIAAAGEMIGIYVHDHLIVAGPHVFSFRAAALL